MSVTRPSVGDKATAAWADAVADAVNGVGLASSGGPVVTAATGFSTPVFTWELFGNLLVLNVDVTRTGATLTAGASGTLPDTTIATITTAAYRPAANVWGTFTTSVSHGGAFISTGGQLTITDAHPTSTISAGDVLHTSWTFPIS
jgi:hypothetical protein